MPNRFRARGSFSSSSSVRCFVPGTSTATWIFAAWTSIPTYVVFVSMTGPFSILAVLPLQHPRILSYSVTPYCLDRVDVMYVREYGKPSEEAFAELEAVVGLKGRRFYGVGNERAGQYRACVRRRKQDDPSSLGLRTGAIEGGLHAFDG